MLTHCYVHFSQVSGHTVAAVNLDPHADFRATEGRHSGNGFSYAYMDGALGFYHVVGLHPGKNRPAAYVS